MRHILRSSARRLASGLVVSLLCTAVAAAPPNVRLVSVTAPPGGDGLTWATAFHDLQPALAAASASGGSISEVWVKAGVYYPAAIGLTSPASTFFIADGLGVYGGFAGVEESRDERNPSANATILNGDLGGTSKRVHHVVTLSGAGPVLDGFIITGGFATGAYPANAGGGITLTGSPVIRGCTITGNTAGGGGIDQPGRGGGIYCGPGSDAVIRSCMIFGNTASNPSFWGYGVGGGLAAEASAVRIESSTFSNNRGSSGGYIGCQTGQPRQGIPGGNGGAIHLSGGAAAVLDRCTLAGNSAGPGGTAPACGGVMTVSAVGTSGGAGGAVFLESSALTLIQCRLTANTAGAGGAGGSSSQPGYAGGAGGSGGAIRAAGSSSSIAIVNSVLAFNTPGAGGPGGFQLPSGPQGVAGPPGGGAGIASQAPISGVNSIFWNSDTTEFTGSGARVITYSCVRAGATGAGVFSTDPLFANPAGGDYRLAAGSPCIDAGSNLADGEPQTPGTQPLPATDLDGLPRFVDDPAKPDTGAGTAPIVDAGPYERRAACRADLNGDGQVDFADYLEFLNLYEAGDPLADFNGDGLVDFADYLEFLNQYESGC